MSDAVSYERHDAVALIRIDDGRVNALSSSVLQALIEAVARAEKEEAGALVLTGRKGHFSAGFDLSEAKTRKGGLGGLFLMGHELSLRLYGARMPVVIACSGHAIAMGGILLMSADLRIGAQGPFKIGMNEVAIKIGLPPLATELGKARLSKRHLMRSLALAEIYDPRGATDAGFLDRTVPAELLLEEALSEARKLTELHGKSHYQVKMALRGELIESMTKWLEDARARA
jgi:enoyl-CoA hydratase